MAAQPRLAPRGVGPARLTRYGWANTGHYCETYGYYYTTDKAADPSHRGHDRERDYWIEKYGTFRNTEYDEWERIGRDAGRVGSGQALEPIGQRVKGMKRKSKAASGE